MHELSLTRNVVAIVSERAAGRRIQSVTLEIGALAAVIPEAMHFCYDLCCSGTSLEGSTLKIVTVPGRARCQSCQREQQIDAIGQRCVCGSARFDFLSGQELNIKEMEVA